MTYTSFKEPGSKQKALRNKSSEKIRDFFQLAARMANPNVKVAPNGEQVLAGAKVVRSPLLDGAFQKCSIDFSASTQSSNISALVKLNDPSSFKMGEQIISWHQDLLSLLSSKEKDPFCLIKDGSLRKRNYLIKRAKLFWAHRLKNKSKQVVSGVSPSLKYFHVDLDICNAKAKNLSFLYWLKYNENEQITDGAIIEAS